MKDVTPRPPRHRSPLLSGVLLMAAGIGLLMINLGYGIPPAVWDYWPLVLVGLGLVGLAAPSRHLNRSGAVWLIAVGTYCEISTLQLFGLTWASAWPIFVIAAGLSMIFRLDARAGEGCRGEGRGGKGKGDDKVLHEA